MKKLLALAIVFAMMFALAIPAAALEITVPNASPVIDGVRDEGLYAGPFSIANKMHGNGEPEPANTASGNCWIAWDSSALYVYVEVYDTTPNFEGENEHSRDSAEFFVDWRNAKGAGLGAPIDDFGSIEGIGTEEGYPFQQIRLPSTTDGDFGDISGANWTGEGWGEVVWGNGDGAFDHFEWVITAINGNIANGYSYEIKAYAPDGITLSEGMKMPFDFQINDNAEGEGRTGMTWMTQYKGNGNQWGTPQGCGVMLTLGGAPAVAEPEPEEPAADDGAAGAGDSGAGGDAGAGAAGGRTPSPRTNDAGIIALIALMAIAAAGVVVLRRKSVR